MKKLGIAPPDFHKVSVMIRSQLSLLALDWHRALGSRFDSTQIRPSHWPVALDFETHLAQLQAKLEKNEITAETMERDQQSQYLAPQQHAPYRTSFNHACVYFLLAEAAAREDIETAWAYLTQAAYITGSAIAGRNSYIGVDAETYDSEQQRKRSAKANRKIREYELVIKLLQENIPLKGFSDTTQAFNMIKSHLGEAIKFDSDLKFGADWERSVKRWLKCTPNGAKQNPVREEYLRLQASRHDHYVQ
ncbi:hypothetical protein ACQKEF_24215 [Pseudomonas oryzihabitans]|uniref:hypothetical protein n=1 Tax=Pseudomonas oryzihabitans TaxID=47885 RepID=UPI003D01D2F6